jgi:hypothetical protein
VEFEKRPSVAQILPVHSTYPRVTGMASGIGLTGLVLVIVGSHISYMCPVRLLVTLVVAP